MNGFLRRALPLGIAAFALLGLGAPAFAQSGSFVHPDVWVSEIDFATGRFEVQIGARDIPVRSVEACMSVGGGVIGCTPSAASWRANSRISFTRRFHAGIRAGAFYIDAIVFESGARRTISFMQWGDGHRKASAAVGAGIWSNAAEFVAKPTTSSHSAQYWNPDNDTPGLATWVSRTATIGAENVPVELASFAAQGVAAGVRLRWRTESETANAGFRILRSNSEAGPFRSVHDDLVPGQGSTPHAADYEHVDETAEPGSLYHYALEDVAHDGATRQSETIAARAGTPR